MTRGDSDLVAVAASLTRGQLLDLLLDVEDRLRLLVRSVFRNKREDWEALIPGSVRTELQEAPSQGGSTQAPSGLLSKATLKQLIDIILARWEFFQPIMEDKAWIQSHLEEMRESRNALAHGSSGRR